MTHTHSALNDDEVRRLAFQLWQRRGCPVGSPEIDWAAAEAQLRMARAAAVSAKRTGPTADNAAIPNAVNTDELFNDEDTPVLLMPALTSFN